MKKLKLSTAGLEGDQLKFVTALNEKFAEMPEVMDKGEMKSLVNETIKETLKELFGEDGKLNVKFFSDLEDLKSMIDGEGEESFKSILKAQGEKINEAIQKLGGSSVHKTVEQAFEEKKDEIVAMIKSRNGSVLINLKAAAVTTQAGSAANSMSAATSRLVGDGGIVEITRGTPFILDFVNVGSTNQPFLIWWDENAKEGDFQITAEGATKTLNQYKFEKKSTDEKKACGYTVLTDEFMNNLPQLATAIRRLMETDCMLDLNEQLLEDILSIAPVYTYADLNGKIANPDRYAAIGAAICQLQALRQNPNVICLNQADVWAMRLEKDDNGRYQMPPFKIDGKDFEFGRVIVDPLIDAGNFLLMDGTVYNVDLKGDIIVRAGYNGNDLITNQMTLLVEQYFLNYISSNKLGALCYGNFEAIQEAIAAA